MSHARSIFLQGLLLQKEYPSFLHKYLKKHWQIWNNWLIENNISPLVACISFINKIKHLDGVIIGIETLEQLKLILNLKVKKLNFDKLATRKKDNISTKLVTKNNIMYHIIVETIEGYNFYKKK